MKLIDVSAWYGNTDGDLYINPETISRIDFGEDEEGNECSWVSFVDDVCLRLNVSQRDLLKRLKYYDEHGI